MLQSIKNTIALLLFFVALDDGATIDINDVVNEINYIIDGRTDIEELTFDELLDIMNVLKQHISNAA